MGIRCWSYCQARARRCSHSGQERAKQHPMALGMRHPAVKATQGHTMPREKRDANSLPACMRNSSKHCPVPLSARAQLAPSHWAQCTAPLLPGHFIDVAVHVSPQNEHSRGPSLAQPPAADGPMGRNTQTEASEILLGQELAEPGVCGAAPQPLPP